MTRQTRQDKVGFTS